MRRTLDGAWMYAVGAAGAGMHTSRQKGATTSRNCAVRTAACTAALLLAGCGDKAILPDGAGTGTRPELPAPKQNLVPTIRIAPAIGWPAGGTPRAAAA